MPVSNEPPPVVSKRNHFHSLDEYVEMAIHQMARHGVFGNDPTEQSKIRTAIRYALGHFLSNIRNAFAIACDSAMDQAEALIKDPDFFENRKARRKRIIVKAAEERAVRQKERQERELFGPTPEEVNRRRAEAVHMIAWHESETKRLRDELARLPNMVGPTGQGKFRDAIVMPFHRGLTGKVRASQRRSEKLYRRAGIKEQGRGGNFLLIFLSVIFPPLALIFVPMVFIRGRREKMRLQRALHHGPPIPEPQHELRPLLSPGWRATLIVFAFLMVAWVVIVSYAATH
jgi:hypothetical protein